jgi:hypothetical protein
VGELVVRWRTVYSHLKSSLGPLGSPQSTPLKETPMKRFLFLSLLFLEERRLAGA